MSIVKNININGTVSKLSAGAYDVTEQNGGRHFSGIAEVLTDATSYIPEADRTPGMQIKFIQDTEALYSVTRTDGLTEQPAGTQVQEIIQLSTGSYYESTLTPLQILLPAVTGSSVTYWYAETDEDEQTTTYSTWTIKKQTNAVSEYVQYRLMSATWSTAVSDWQGVDDEPVANSTNLISSDAVYNSNISLSERFLNDISSFEEAYYAINTNGIFGKQTSNKHGYISVRSGERYIIKAKSDKVLRYAFVTSSNVSSGGIIPVVSGTQVVEVPYNTKVLITIPSECLYLLLYNVNGADFEFYCKRQKEIDEEPVLGSDDLVSSKGIAESENILRNWLMSVSSDVYNNVDFEDALI